MKKFLNKLKKQYLIFSAPYVIKEKYFCIFNSSYFRHFNIETRWPKKFYQMNQGMLIN